MTDQQSVSPAVQFKRVGVRVLSPTIAAMSERLVRRCGSVDECQCRVIVWSGRSHRRPIVAVAIRV